MPKILLINPNFENPFVYKKNDIRDSPGIPRGVLSMGTYLKHHGYEIKIIDMRLSENSIETIKEEAKDALWIGLSVMTTQVRDALKISQELKQITKVPIIWGGIHPTLFPEKTCKDELVDLVIFGEGEETALELSNLLSDDSGGIDYSKVKGLVYKNENQVIKNEWRDHLDLNTLPRMNFDLIDIERYIWRSIPGHKEKQRLLPIESSRGCPHRCAFCFHVLCNDRVYRVEDAEKTVNDIKYLIDKYKITALLFAEDNFFVRRKRVVEICNKLIENNIHLPWKAECRADYFREGFVDDELLSLIKRAGCNAFTIGAESGSAKTLQTMKKDITPKQIINCAKQCNKYKIYGSFSFISGLPDESISDVKKTIKMIKKVRKLCPISSIGFGIYRPYPGGPLYKKCFEIAKIKEPETLRNWIEKDYVNLMSLDSNIPWNKNSAYIQNASFYVRVFFFCTKDHLKRYIRRNPILGLGFSAFVLLCSTRVYLNFFAIPAEKYFFKYVLKKMKITLPL